MAKLEGAVARLPKSLRVHIWTFHMFQLQHKQRGRRGEKKEKERRARAHLNGNHRHESSALFVALNDWRCGGSSQLLVERIARDLGFTVIGPWSRVKSTRKCDGWSRQTVWGSMKENV